MKLAVVIPAFNEQKRIGEVLRSLKPSGLDVIVVDDGSRDKTSEVASLSHVVVLRHKINLGKGAAIKTGCEAAFFWGADAVIVMDSDSQHKVEDLEKFINAIKNDDYDVVFGSRNWVRGIPLVRYLGNKFGS